MKRGEPFQSHQLMHALFHSSHISEVVQITSTFEIRNRGEQSKEFSITLWYLLHISFPIFF